MARITAKLINRQNKITILNLIRQQGTVSRAELAKISGMSAPTVTRIVDSLINTEHLVREAGEGDSSGGRRPNLVSFNGEDHYVIGIDLSPRFITAVLSDLTSRVIISEHQATNPEDGFELIMSRVAALIKKMISESGFSDGKIIGVGLGIAGFIDIHEHIVLTSPNFGWERVHPDKELGKYIDYPVVYDNLTRVMALGELHYAAGERFDNFICLKMGMGLGSGVIIDRKPFFGAHGFGSEAGHTIINSASSYRCKCGNMGCFEALVSGQYILSKIETVIEGEEYVSLMGEPDPLASAIAMIISDTERFSELLEELIENLSLGITNLIHSYDPEAIVLGGVVSELGDQLIKPVRRRVRDLVIPHFHTECEILKAAAGEQSVAMGAVALILEEVLNLNI